MFQIHNHKHMSNSERWYTEVAYKYLFDYKKCNVK